MHQLFHCVPTTGHSHDQGLGQVDDQEDLCPSAQLFNICCPVLQTQPAQGPGDAAAWEGSSQTPRWAMAALECPDGQQLIPREPGASPDPHLLHTEFLPREYWTTVAKLLIR